MNKSFRSKALQAFWTRADVRKLPVQNSSRVKQILLALNVAERPESMNDPGQNFHGLQTNPKRRSVWVTGNYRITFAFKPCTTSPRSGPG